jgi:drug/metabolite transporter (DMT)-like permease
MPLSRAAKQRFLFAILCVVWGMTWLAMKAGINAVPPGIFSALRWTIAGVALVGWRLARGEPIATDRRTLLHIYLMSLLMLVLNPLIMLYGLRYTSSGLASVLSSALTPIAMVWFASLLGQERFTRREVAAVALGVCGILVLYGPKAAAGTLGWPEALGSLAIILGNTIYCLASVLARPTLRTIPPGQWVALSNIMGGVTLLVLCIAFEPGAIPALAFQWPTSALIGIVFLICAGSLGATVIFFLLVRDWGAGRTGMYAFISPIIAVFLGMVTYGEPVGLIDVVGMAAMLAAAGIAMRRRA